MRAVPRSQEGLIDWLPDSCRFGEFHIKHQVIRFRKRSVVPDSCVREWVCRDEGLRDLLENEIHVSSNPIVETVMAPFHLKPFATVLTKSGV